MMRMTAIFTASLLLCLSMSSASASDRSAVHSVNMTGAKLFRVLNEKEKNICFSPLSIVSLFASLSLGADGKTADYVRDAFALSSDVHGSMRDLIYNITNGPVDAGTLELASGMWPRKGYTLKKGFLHEIDKYYGTEVSTLDYEGSPEASVREINDWIATRTRGKILHLLDEASVGPRTALVMANAMYFRAPWARAFSEEETRHETFHKRSSDVTVPMMHNVINAELSRGNGYSAVKLLYAYGAYSMTIYLPDDGQSVESVCDEVLSDIAAIAPRKCSDRVKIDLSMPKFRIDAATDLKRPLSDIGVGILFDSQKADLSGINGARDLYVSDALHRAVLEVSEKGTEGAAATAIGIRTTAFYPETDPLEFRADRPFIFTICDEISGVLIFMGALEDPLE